MSVYFDKYNGMICYETTADDLDRAEKEYQQRFPEDNMVNKKTVYNRKSSRMAGIIGEIVFEQLYPDAKHPEKDITYDYDYMGKKVDVKCKYRKVPPTPEFQASFFMYQARRGFNADLYYFMSTVHDFSKVWLCGIITKDNIMNNPNREIWRAGEVDPANGMEFREDTLCLKYKYLDKIVLITGL